MAKTKADLLEEIKCLKHNYYVKVDHCERLILVNQYLLDLLKQNGVTDKNINDYIFDRDKNVRKEPSRKLPSKIGNVFVC